MSDTLSWIIMMQLFALLAIMIAQEIHRRRPPVRANPHLPPNSKGGDVDLGDQPANVGADKLPMPVVPPGNLLHLCQSVSHASPLPGWRQRYSVVSNHRDVRGDVPPRSSPHARAPAE